VDQINEGRFLRAKERDLQANTKLRKSSSKAKETVTEMMAEEAFSKVQEWRDAVASGDEPEPIPWYGWDPIVVREEVRRVASNIFVGDWCNDVVGLPGSRESVAAFELASRFAWLYKLDESDDAGEASRLFLTIEVALKKLYGDRGEFEPLASKEGLSFEDYVAATITEMIYTNFIDVED
jgi:hypothetical protein